MGIFGIGEKPAGTPQPTGDTQRLQDMAAGAGLYYYGTKVYKKTSDTFYDLAAYFKQWDMGSAEQRKKIQEARNNLKIQAHAIDMAIDNHVNPTRIIQYMNGNLSSTYLFADERKIMTDAIKKVGIIESKKL